MFWQMFVPSQVSNLKMRSQLSNLIISSQVSNFIMLSQVLGLGGIPQVIDNTLYVYLVVPRLLDEVGPKWIKSSYLSVHQNTVCSPTLKPPVRIVSERPLNKIHDMLNTCVTAVLGNTWRSGVGAGVQKEVRLEISVYWHAITSLSCL